MKPVIKTIIALAFFIQAMIPMGFMPNLHAADNKGAALVICSGLGTKTIFLDHKEGKTPSPVQKDFSKSCPYAGLSLFDVPLAADPVSASFEYPLPVDEPVHHEIIPARKYLKPEAIGPPALI